jgi:glycosyltransferase involved in cell wall biosynthesis
VLRPISARYRIQGDMIRSGPQEPGVVHRRLPVFPKLLFDRFINPVWQKHSLARFAENLPCDLIHVHTCTQLAVGAVLAGHRRGLPVVLTLRREASLADQPKWKARQLIFAMQRADSVISPSAHLADKCRQYVDHDVLVIASGTDPLFDDPPPQGQLRARRVLFVGALEHNKGIAPLLDASLALMDRGEDFELTIIGDGPLRPSLQRRASGRAVRFLGSIPPIEVREQMRQAQLLCVPSYTETLGLIYLEAMKQDLPVVGRRGTGIDGMGVRGEHYELIEHDGEIGPTIDRLLNDQDCRRKLARNGRQLAAGWTWRNTARQHHIVYERILADRRPALADRGSLCDQKGV